MYFSSLSVTLATAWQMSTKAPAASQVWSHKAHRLRADLLLLHVQRISNIFIIDTKASQGDGEYAFESVIWC